MRKLFSRLFDEPKGGTVYLLILILGCAQILSTLLLPVGDREYRMLFLAIGSALVLMGAPELLPRNWMTAAGLLRAAAILVAASVFVLAGTVLS